jgi:threonyl-tRNA synthetase
MPEQFAILPISDRFIDYSKKVMDQLATHDIRGYIDDRSEKIGRKIRDTELKKIPFMLIVGEKEVENDAVSVRLQGEGDKGSMSVDEFATYFKSLL